MDLKFKYKKWQLALIRSKKICKKIFVRFCVLFPISRINVFPIIIPLSHKQKSDWTEEDFALLAKVMAKYPGGTPGRWQRIAHDLGRSASDVRLRFVVFHTNFEREEREK